MKRSVCARNWSVFIYIFLFICPTILTTAGAWWVNVLWHSRRMHGSDLSHIYITHCLHHPFGFVCVCFIYSQSRGSHWLPLYDWQIAMVWVKTFCLCSEETKSPTSRMPWGKQINITFSFFGWTIPLITEIVHPKMTFMNYWMLFPNKLLLWFGYFQWI